LTLFTKEPDDCQNTFERIIYVLKNMDILERMPWMAQDAVFKRLASIAEIAAMSEKQRLEYDESLRKYRDTLSVTEGQYQEGTKDVFVLFCQAILLIFTVVFDEFQFAWQCHG